MTAEKPTSPRGRDAEDDPLDAAAILANLDAQAAEEAGLVALMDAEPAVVRLLLELDELEHRLDRMRWRGVGPADAAEAGAILARQDAIGAELWRLTGGADTART